MAQLNLRERKEGVTVIWIGEREGVNLSLRVRENTFSMGSSI